MFLASIAHLPLLLIAMVATTLVVVLGNPLIWLFFARLMGLYRSA